MKYITISHSDSCNKYYIYLLYTPCINKQNIIAYPELSLIADILITYIDTRKIASTILCWVLQWFYLLQLFSVYQCIMAHKSLQVAATYCSNEWKWAWHKPHSYTWHNTQKCIHTLVLLHTWSLEFYYITSYLNSCGQYARVYYTSSCLLWT